MIRSALLTSAFFLSQPTLLLAKGDKKVEEKKPKKKKDGKKKDGKGGPFTACDALTTKADCEKHAKDHYCSWDPISAGGSCSEGAPM